VTHHSDDEADLLACLEGALMQSEALSLGFVAIHIAAALDRLRLELGANGAFPDKPSNDS
jgi:hypothetical protein